MLLQVEQDHVRDGSFIKLATRFRRLVLRGDVSAKRLLSVCNVARSASCAFVVLTVSDEPSRAVPVLGLPQVEPRPFGSSRHSSIISLMSVSVTASARDSPGLKSPLADFRAQRAYRPGGPRKRLTAFAKGYGLSLRHPEAGISSAAELTGWAFLQLLRELIEGLPRAAPLIRRPANTCQILCYLGKIPEKRSVNIAHNHFSQ